MSTECLYYIFHFIYSPSIGGMKCVFIIYVKERLNVNGRNWKEIPFSLEIIFVMCLESLIHMQGYIVVRPLLHCFLTSHVGTHITCLWIFGCVDFYAFWENSFLPVELQIWKLPIHILVLPCMVKLPDYFFIPGCLHGRCLIAS